MELAPDPRTVPEFTFRRLCNLKVTPAGAALDRSHALNVVSTSNKFGVIFVGVPSGVQCIPVSDVVELQATRPNNRGNIENYKRRELTLGCLPSHVAVNCVGELLAVVVHNQQVPVLQIYSVQSFGAQELTKKAEVRLSSTPSTRAVDVQWNPAIPNMIGCVLGDGSAMVCEFSPNGPVLSSAPAAAQATCLCWSPKGKQVVLGGKNGTLTQYKPDLKPVKSYPPPQIGTGPVEVVSIHWLSTTQFLTVYRDKSDAQPRSTVVVVNVPKTGQSFVNHEDVCFGSDVTRPEHYFIHVAAWNILIISTGNGYEASVLHQENDSWVMWRQDEGYRAELPLNENNIDDVFAVGMGLNTSATKPLQIGDSASAPPMPFLLFMSEQGVLSIFHTINLVQGAAGLCSPPEELPKQMFSVPSVGELGKLPLIQPVAPQAKPGTAVSGIGAGEGGAPSLLAGAPPSQPVKPGFGASAFQMGSQLLAAAQSPFQLSGATSNLPSFGNLTAQRVAPTPSPFASNTQASPASVKPVVLNVPKAQSTFGLGTTLTGLTQSPGIGFFGGSSTAKTESVLPPSAASTAPENLGAQFSLSSTSSSMTSQLLPKPQVTVITAPASGVTAPVASFQPAVPPPAPSPPKVDPPAAVGPPPVDESMIMNEINKEVLSVKNLLANFKLDSAAVSKLEKDKLTLPDIRVKLHDLEVFEEELQETTASEQAEVNSLKVGIVEMMSSIENIKAKQRESTSQRYLDVLDMRELDPVLKKLLKNIEQTALYVETKLKEATHHLNVTWEKQKEPGSLKNFDIPNMEAIYQIIAMNMRILAIQEARAVELENRLANALKLRKKTVPRILTETKLQWKPDWTGMDSSRENAQLEKLADKLLQTRINSDAENSLSINEASNRYMAMANFRKELPEDKEIELSKWLKSHKVIRTKVARPAVPNNDVLNRSFAKSTPIKSPVPLAETPVAKAVGRSLFPQVVPSLNPMVTSTPLSKADDVKFKEKTKFTMSSFETPAVSAKLVDPMPAQTVTKALGLPFGGIIGGKETVSTPTFTALPQQSASPKVEISLFSSPQTQKPKESPKTESTIAETTSSPLSSKSATSTNVISLLSSGSTVTISEKDKAPGSTTTASSIFSGSAFSQSVGFPGFGTNFGGTTQSASAATTTTPPKPLFGSTAPSFSTSLTSTAPTTGATTTTSSFAFGNVSAPGQNLFSGSGFSFAQTSKPASSSSAPAPSVSIFSLPSTASTTSLSSPTPSAFPSFGAAVPSPAVVTVTSQPKPQPVPATEVSSTVTQASSSTAATTTAHVSTVTSPAAASSAASSPSVVPTTQLEKLPVTNTTTEFTFSNVTLTPVPATQAFGSPAFQTVQTTTATTSAQSFSGAEVSVFPSSSQSFSSPTFAATTTANIFGGAAAATATTSSVFQTPPKSAAAFSGGSLFGASTTSTPSFSAVTTSAPAFGTPTTSAPSAFGTPTTSTLSFGTPTTSAPAFGTPTSSTQPTFGTPTSSAPSVFGAPTTSAAFGTAPATQSPFGGESAPAFSATSSSTSVFGTPTTTSTTDLFGAVNALSSTSFFGSPTTTSSAFGTQSGSLFGGTSSFSTPSTSSSSIFGAKICSPDANQPQPNNSNPFAGSPFGQKTATPGSTFGGTPSFGSFRPSTPGAFGSSGGSIFGGGGSTFGQTTPQGSLFQSGGSSPNVFGAPTQPSGAFSGGGQNVQQSGFGSFGSPQQQQQQQQQPRPFGASGGSVFGGQAAFGSSPTFGGTATFGGSPTKVFGAAAPAAPAFGAPTQQSSTFENLAAQNTVSFGNLAQTPPPFGGGAGFGQPQPQPQPQQRPQTSAFSNTPAFGGSSFSSWR